METIRPHVVRSDMSTDEVNPKPLGYLAKFLWPFSILHLSYHWQLNFLLKSSPEFQVENNKLTRNPSGTFLILW